MENDDEDSNGVPSWVYEEQPDFDINKFNDEIAEMNKEVEEFNKMTDLQKVVKMKIRSKK